MRRRRNDGIRKRCGCAARNWPKCPHPWHLNFKWKEQHYRLSIDKEVGRRIEGKTEAEAEAERIRTANRDGVFRVSAKRVESPGECRPAPSPSRPSRKSEDADCEAGPHLHSTRFHLGAAKSGPRRERVSARRLRVRGRGWPAGQIREDSLEKCYGGGRPGWAPASRLAPRSRVTLRRGRRPDQLHEQDPRAFEPEHYESVTEHPPSRASGRHAEAGESPSRRCTTVAQEDRGRTSRCAGLGNGSCRQPTDSSVT